MGAKSANQILPLKFCGGTEVLHYIHLTTLSSWRVEGESGFRTIYGQTVLALHWSLGLAPWCSTFTLSIYIQQVYLCQWDQTHVYGFDHYGLFYLH